MNGRTFDIISDDCAVSSTGEGAKWRPDMPVEKPLAGAYCDDVRTPVPDHAVSALSYLLDAIPDGFAVFDAEDRLQIFNRRYTDLNSGISDIIKPGSSFERIIRTAIERKLYDTSGIDAEHYIQWRIEQHLNPGEPSDLLLNSGCWLRLHEKRMQDGSTVLTLSDITEQKQRESELSALSNELRRANMHFHTALNNMTLGLCMYDAEKRLIISNQRYLDLYGFEPDVVKPGILYFDVIKYSARLGNMSGGDIQLDPHRIIDVNNDPFGNGARPEKLEYPRNGRIIAVRHQPMPDGGCVETHQDVTELHHHASERAQYTKRLEASNRELQDFAYVASHDLQEPLRKIETFGDRLKSKYAADLPENAVLYIDRMQNATGRMRSLISDLLDYSRITTTSKPFALLDLNSVVAGVLSDLQICIQETGAVIDHGPLPQIEADATQIRQLLQNLVCNALKFRRKDVPPVIKMSVERAGCDLSPDAESMIMLKVADNGIGFDNRYKDQIFTIFQRLHGRSEYEGTGIGLATCRKIAERHGGTIDAQGVEGKGAVFTVTLRVNHQTD